MHPADDKVSALFNLNSNLSSLVVCHHKMIIHAHDQTYDGRKLLNQVNEYFKKNPITDASLATIAVKEEGYQHILKENLMAHLRHSLHLFFSSKPNINRDQIILAGHCAAIPGLAKFIKKEVNIDVVIGNPFLGM